jgi:sterol desaturase/sphingolipid hydroxylase (fatty acid hydroxylase superfamily)
LFHRIPWLWRLHAVHHSDTELDFTSTYRHHPLENLLGTIAAIPLTLLLGPPVIVIAVYQGFRVTVNILSHSNIYLPETLERWLRRLIVTPDFHRGHHSTDRQYTNSNYGSSLTVFDHLFGTATQRTFNEQADMPVGLHYFRGRRDSRLDQLLLMPFREWPDDTLAQVE